jgi:hypothetical protein
MLEYAEDYVSGLRNGITAFSTANHYALNSWQLEVATLMLDPDADQEDYAGIVAKISEKVGLLEQARWRPAQRLEGDMVNRPVHYDRMPYEPTTFSMDHGLNWCIANALKYVCRYTFKNGTEDLRKAMRYLAMYIRWLDGDPNWSK